MGIETVGSHHFFFFSHTVNKQLFIKKT